MDTEPTVNIPLLRKAVEWAEAEAAKPNPLDRQWVQKEWRTAPEWVPLIGLFNGGNTIKDIRRIAEDIAGEPL